MTGPVRVVLVGDHDPAVTAHRAIPLALVRSAEALEVTVTTDWPGTERLAADAVASLHDADGIWCVPASPYRSEAGALAAIRYARERAVPFLGTCGGFQHALLEYARHVRGLAGAVHGETSPDAADAVITPLACGLVEESGEVTFRTGSRLAAAYGAAEAREMYHCRYGLNPAHAERLFDGRLAITAIDPAGEVRGVELAGHPFFVATLYQPERAGLAGAAHPVVSAFLAAAAAHGSARARVGQGRGLGAISADGVR